MDANVPSINRWKTLFVVVRLTRFNATTNMYRPLKKEIMAPVRVVQLKIIIDCCSSSIDDGEVVGDVDDSLMLLYRRTVVFVFCFLFNWSFGSD